MQEQKCYFQKEHGGFTIKVNFKKKDDYQVNKQEPLEKKYNVKFRKNDLMLMDYLAKSIGCSRSYLINKLIESFLLKGLDGIKEHDVRALLAETADSLANTEYNSSWQESILSNSGYVRSTIKVMKKCNSQESDNQYLYDDPDGYCQNSDSYDAILEMLKKIKG